MTSVPTEVLIYVFPEGADKNTDAVIRQSLLRYGEETGLPVSEHQLTVSRTERGKPYLPDRPDLFVSVSHSDSLCVCAVAALPVGIDLQTHTRLQRETEADAIKRLQSIAKRFFHPAELPYLMEGDAVRRFFLLWTARESFVKWSGDGIDNNFSSWCVLPEDGPLPLPSKEGALWQAAGKWFTLIPFKENFTMCLCTERAVSFRVISFSDQAPFSNGI